MIPRAGQPSTATWCILPATVSSRIVSKGNLWNVGLVVTVAQIKKLRFFAGSTIQKFILTSSSCWFCVYLHSFLLILLGAQTTKTYWVFEEQLGVPEVAGVHLLLLLCMPAMNISGFHCWIPLAICTLAQNSYKNTGTVLFSSLLVDSEEMMTTWEIHLTALVLCGLKWAFSKQD